MTGLGLCLAALVLGPFVYQLSRARQATYAFFDGFVLVAVGGLVLFDILPDTVTALGAIALPVALAGFFFPHLLEHRLGSLPVSPRTILSTIIIAGLILHQLLDGAALRVPGGSGGEHALSTLGLAVIVHQVPKGFLLWQITRKASGVPAAVLVIAGLLAATATGYLLGGRALEPLEHVAVLWFQAFVAGGLLHVVVHHVSCGPEGLDERRTAFAGGLGALAAGAAFVLLRETHGLEPLSEKASGLRATFLALSLESAPSILLGFVASGILHAFVSVRSLQLFHGRSLLSQSLRGILFGIPLPVCSCGVTPIYRTLIRRGVPAAAGVSFLIATPEIGLDSFFLSLGLLGIEVTLVRLGMAFAVALLASLALGRLYSRVLPLPEGGADELAPGTPPEGFGAKLRAAFQYGCVDLVGHIGAWLLVGIAIAAVLEPYLDPGWFTGLPRGLDVVLLALAGLPIYVCASGATPLAAVLLSKGVSVGAVLAFLITGPTTNVTTFGILSRIHGPARALALPAVVFALSVSIGLAVNAVFGPDGQPGPLAAATADHGALETACAVALAALLAHSVLRLGPRTFLGKLSGDRSLGQPVGDPCEEARPDGHDHDHAHAREA